MSLEIEISELVVGNTYNLWIDDCCVAIEIENAVFLKQGENNSDHTGLKFDKIEFDRIYDHAIRIYPCELQGTGDCYDID